MKRILALATIAVSLAVAGCQSSSIDTMQTTALGQSRDPAAADLATGKKQFEDGNFGLAEQHFRKAVELRATSAEGWMGLAAAYDQLGRFDFADRAYEQVLSLVGRRPQVINNMGYSHYLRGDRKKAKKLLLEARDGLEDKTIVDANLALLKKA